MKQDQEDTGGSFSYGNFVDAAVDFASRLRNALFPVVVPPARTILIVQQPEARVVPPPTGNGFYIGKSSDAGDPVIASPEALDRHLLIIGGTGCGKTTLIARLFTEEILKWQ